MQPAKRGDTLGARPQHQVIGVGKQKLGAGGAHVVVMDALDRACVPTGMKAGVCTAPCAVVISPARAAPSVAMRWKAKGSDIGNQT